MENCQVAVYLSYARRGGHALIDRELYLPESWIADKDRCAAAGILGGTAFATKPDLAWKMTGRALAAGVPAGWVAGDEVYGADPGLRAGLEGRGVSYVLAVAKSHQVTTTAAGALRADTLARKLPPRAWQRLPAGPGAKGHRYHDWAWAAIGPGQPGHRWLLIRRTGAPANWPITAATHPAMSRSPFWSGQLAAGGWRRRTSRPARAWPLWMSIRCGAGPPWYRWVTLAMLALAFLTIAALAEHTQPPPPGLTPLTSNEIAHRATALITRPARDTGYLRRSAWRRHHQHTARTCHYQRQAARGP